MAPSAVGLTCFIETKTLQIRMYQKQITSPVTAEQFIRPVFQGLDHEECWCNLPLLR